MKHLTALFVALALLLCGAAFAAGWGPGLGPDKPYSHSTPIDLNTTFGYIILFPRDGKAADGFCNKLLMYFPREDVYPGVGNLTLNEFLPGQTEPVEVCTVDMSDRRNVTIRPMTEDEKTFVIWGSGTVAEIRLPWSLEYADRVHNYFVFMDEGCLTAGADHSLKSPRISRPEAWHPTIEGDYGISGFRYVECEAPSENTEQDLDALFAQLEAEADAAEAAENGIQADALAPQSFAIPQEGQTFGIQQEDQPLGIQQEDQPLGIQQEDQPLGIQQEDQPAAEPTATPEPAPQGPTVEELDAAPPIAWPNTGDKIIFDLVLGGEAKVAIPFSENGSVMFDQTEYTESGHIIGTVVKDDVDWGILFRRGIGEGEEGHQTLQMLMLGTTPKNLN